jgi:hypothetical protein
MAETTLRIRPTKIQTFNRTGSATICTLDFTPNEIMKVTVDGAEIKTYTANSNNVTVNANSGSTIEINYNYWTNFPNTKGEDGKSAYEYAVEGGYTGSETDFYTAVANVANKQATINATGILMGNGNGNVTSATAGSHYVVPTGNVATATALANARTIQTNLASISAASFNGTVNVTPGVTGVLPVANGGTGNNGVDTSPTNGSTKMVTSGGVFTALSGKANSSHNQAASTISAGTLGGTVVANASSVSGLGTKQVRNIHAGTSDLTAGTSALPAGDIYIVYET